MKGLPKASKASLRLRTQITKSQLVDVALDSIKTRNDLSLFWEYVAAARESGLLDMTAEQVRAVVARYEDFVFGKGEELRQEVKKLSDKTDFRSRGDFSEEGSPHSLMLPVPEEARQKAAILLKDIVAQYGWRVTQDGHSFHRDDLGLHIYGGNHPRLVVDLSSKVSFPCLRLLEFRHITVIRDDIVATILVTCLTDEVMAKHIDKFSPGFHKLWLERRNKK